MRKAGCVGEEEQDGGVRTVQTDERVVRVGWKTGGRGRRSEEEATG